MRHPLELLRYARVWALTLYLLAIGFFVLMSVAFRAEFAAVTTASQALRTTSQEMPQRLAAMEAQLAVFQDTLLRHAEEQQQEQVRHRHVLVEQLHHLRDYETLHHPVVGHLMDLDHRLRGLEAPPPTTSP